MSEERAPYYVGNVPQIPLVQRPETWQAITFSDGSTLEVMTRSPNNKTLAVQWAQVLQRWLDEQLEGEELFGPNGKTNTTGHGPHPPAPSGLGGEGRFGSS